MKLRVSQFDLQHTLESGQFFRYQKIGEWYYCHERDVLFKIRQRRNTLEYFGTSSSHIKRLFGLRDDYESIISDLSADRTLRPLIRQFAGLRIMQRDPWETLVSFQCGIMSNVKKIKRNQELIAATFGKPLRLDAVESFSFPNPGDICDLQRLKACATGFRSKYIHGANSTVTDRWLAGLKRASYDTAKQSLITLPGIAEKVADCICLFGLGKTDAFPVDVWIERVMTDRYFNGEKTTHKNIRAFARRKWGTHAGYAQQFLYHHARWSHTKQSTKS